MESDGMERDRMYRNGIRWDGAGCDGLGWAGARWVRGRGASVAVERNGNRIGQDGVISGGRAASGMRLVTCWTSSEGLNECGSEEELPSSDVLLHGQFAWHPRLQSSCAEGEGQGSTNQLKETDKKDQGNRTRRKCGRPDATLRSTATQSRRNVPSCRECSRGRH